jgi:hypothetical protein
MARRRRAGPRPRRALMAGFVVGLLGLPAAACSSGPPRPSVASVPGQSDARSTAVDAPTEQQTDLDIIDYTHCLRAHGVNEPDPHQVTHDGSTGLAFDVPPSSPTDLAATAACRHFIAKLLGAKQAGARQELARWLPSLVRYAACMRRHDIAMLDPGPEGELNLGDVPGITSDFGRYSPQFRAADAACRHLLPAGVHDDGTGP